jgi:hypothetical protein
MKDIHDRNINACEIVEPDFEERIKHLSLTGSRAIISARWGFVICGIAW